MAENPCRRPTDPDVVGTLEMKPTREKKSYAFVCASSTSVDESARFRRIMPLAEAVL